MSKKGKSTETAIRFIFPKHNFIDQKLVPYHHSPHPIGYWIRSKILLMEAHPIPASTSYRHFAFFSSLQSFLQLEQSTHYSLKPWLCVCPSPVEIVLFLYSTFVNLTLLPTSPSTAKLLSQSLQHFVHPWVTSALPLKETS